MNIKTAIFWSKAITFFLSFTQNRCSAYRSSNESTGGDYFFNWFAPKTGSQQKAQHQREHDAYWEERGKEHGEFWKNTMNVLVKVVL